MFSSFTIKLLLQKYCDSYLLVCTFPPPGLPSPALFQTPSYSVQEYDRDNVTIRVLWQSPQDDGGAPVVNYTITVSPGLIPLTTTATSAMVTLPYNVMHTVSIVVTNCNGSSSVVMETIPAIVGCGEPSHPENGFVQSLDISQGTQQGSEIFFGCNTSYIPAGNMISTCASDRMWNPDPATFMCICKFIHCSSLNALHEIYHETSDFTFCYVGR